MGKRKHDEIADSQSGKRESPSKRRRVETPPHPQVVQDFLVELAPQLGVAVEPGDEDAMQGVERDVDPDDAETDWDGADEQDGLPSDDEESGGEDEEFDPTRMEGLEPTVLRSGTQLTGDGPITADGLPRSLPLDLATAKALFEQARKFRDLRRESFDVSERKPTFYTYMIAPTGKAYSRFFTDTPHTDAVEEMVTEEQRADPGFSVDLDSEFSLQADLRVPDRPAKVSGNTNLYKDHVTIAAQGPHSLAHVLIEEMLQRGLPQDLEAAQEPDAMKRWARRLELWTAVEGMYLSQVDTPATFRRLVAGELDSTQVNERVEFAVQRHQELFNQIEGLLSLHAARKLVVKHSAGDQPPSWLDDQLEEDGEDIDNAHNVLGELMELAPFGSYAWHDGRGASAEQLGGKGESRDGLDEAMALLRAARSPADVARAVEGMAELLAGLFDFEQGQFVDLQAYQAFLVTRLELAGAPDQADRLLRRVLQLKGAG